MRPARFLKAFGHLWAETISSWQEDNAFRLSAALAYYACFSLAPILIIAITIAGAVFGNAIAQGQALGQIQGLIGKAGSDAIGAMLVNASRHTVRASVIGVTSLIFGATGVFVSLQDGLNTVWQVKPKPMNWIIGFFRQRLHTFTLVLGVGFLLLVSLLISAAISAAAHYFGGSAPTVWRNINFVVSLAIITFVFAMIFKLLPDVEMRWGDVWLGAAVTSVLFTLGKYAIGYYVGSSSFTSVYGTAGSLVLILAWVYYSSLILFLGAEFTRAYANHYGSRIRPKPHAEPLTPEHRAQQGMEPRKRSAA